MTDKAGIVRLTRVAHVRGLRLARAAEAARLEHEAAERQRDDAHQALARHEALTIEARAMFVHDPACPQARMWLDHSVAQMAARADALIEAESNVDHAARARAEAVHVVARHQVRSDRIAAHHDGLRRIDRLQAEMRAELDVPVQAARSW